MEKQFRDKGNEIVWSFILCGGKLCEGLPHFWLVEWKKYCKIYSQKQQESSLWEDVKIIICQLMVIPDMGEKTEYFLDFGIFIYHVLYGRIEGDKVIRKIHSCLNYPIQLILYVVPPILSLVSLVKIKLPPGTILIQQCLMRVYADGRNCTLQIWLCLLFSVVYWIRLIGIVWIVWNTTYTLNFKN